MTSFHTVALIGGTGPEGKGLAARFSKAGLEVVIGSRSAERGEEAGREVAELSRGQVRGGTNAAAVSAADIVVVTLPYAGLSETLGGLTGELAGRIVVSAVVPLRFTKTRVELLRSEAGSAAEEAQGLLPGARVVGAFHNLSAKHLLDLEHPVEGDVVVCSDDPEATAKVIELAGLIEGARGVNGGPLANTRYVEAMTALLININRIHKAETELRIVGL
jgi:NADPH-dependent F420 reductase